MLTALRSEFSMQQQWGLHVARLPELALPLKAKAWIQSPRIDR